MNYLLAYLAVFTVVFTAAVITRKRGYFGSFWQALVICFFWPALIVGFLIELSANFHINERLDRFWTGEDNT